MSSRKQKPKQALRSASGDHGQRQAILETAFDCIISIDTSGKVVEWNPAAAQTFGYRRADVLGKLMADLIIPPESREAHMAGLQRYVSTGTARVVGKRVEVTAMRADGTTLPVELSLVADSLYGEKIITAFLRDVSDRKAADVELAAARDKAVEASRLKSQFLATISHELRTPLNGILGMSALLLDTELDDTQRAYAKAVQQSGKTLHSIIEDLLDFSEVEQGRVVLESTQFDLPGLIERTTREYADRARERGLELHCRIGEGVPAVVRGDGGRIAQVLGCLLDNAIKFTSRGDIVVRLASIANDAEWSRIRLDVADSGGGIPAERRAELFHPFVQGDGSTTRRFGGTGLGLSICSELVGMMGGTIDVDSEVGVGTTVRCELPLASVGRVVSHEAAPLGARRVLIVDSSVAGQEALIGYLSSWNIRVDTSADSASAMARLDDALDVEPVGLVLVASRLAGGSGIDVSRAINGDSRFAGIPVVLLTETGEACPIEAATRAGISRLIPKPISRSHLYNTIVELDASGRGARDTLSVTGAGFGTITGMRCLVVEDNIINQQVLTAMLESMGHTVAMADNGVEAVNAYEPGKFDVIFMDIQMPEMDGYDATRRIREIEGGNSHTPVVAVTANAMKGDREACIRAGMDDYVPKPVDPNALTAAIGRVGERFLDLDSRDVPPAATGEPNTNNATIPTAAANPACGAAKIDHSVLDKLATYQRPGQPDMVTRLIDLYLGQSPDQIEAIAAAVAGDAAEELARAAHALKGASGNLGALKLSEIAAGLERAGRDGSLAEAPTLLAQLREEYALVERDLGARRVPEAAQARDAAV